MTKKPDFVLQTFIRCSQDALWDALTDPEQMQEYHFLARRVEKEGDTYSLFHADGTPMFRARTLEADPKTRIVSTFEPQWDAQGAAPSRTVFTIEPKGEMCALTLEHFDLTHPVVPGQGVADGWAKWAASLKTWLETGTPMHFDSVSEAEPA